MTRDDRLQLAHLGLHPERTRRLTESWGTAGAVLRAIELGQIPVSEAIRGRLALDSWAAAKEADASIDWKEHLPALLQQLPDCPDLLFRRGAKLPSPPGVAIVGTRRATRYGLDVARRFGRAVALAGWPVVSGLARGIDGAAHIGALRGAVSPSPCSVVEWTGVTHQSIATWPAASSRPGDRSFPSTALDPLQRRGGSPLGTGSSPASVRRWWWWRPG